MHHSMAGGPSASGTLERCCSPQAPPRPPGAESPVLTRLPGDLERVHVTLRSAGLGLSCNNTAGPRLPTVKPSDDVGPLVTICKPVALSGRPVKVFSAALVKKGKMSPRRPPHHLLPHFLFLNCPAWSPLCPFLLRSRKWCQQWGVGPESPSECPLVQDPQAGITQTPTERGSPQHETWRPWWRVLA